VQITRNPATPGGEAEEVAGGGSPEPADESEENPHITRILEPIPAEDEEIRVRALHEPPPEAAEEETTEQETVAPPEERDWGFDDEDDDRKESPMPKRDWLSEVSREERATLEWPAGEGTDPRERERIDTPRVRHLFQVPEDADWEVRELEYDRRRTASR
jgi:hypothetical protein